MLRKDPAAPLYGLAALAASLFWVTRPSEAFGPGTFLGWLVVFFAPLLFVFAYPRFLFRSRSSGTSSLRSAAILHALGAATTTLLFVVLGSSFGKNPLRDPAAWSLPLVLVALPVCLVAAFSLLLRNRSALAPFATLLFWPYWLLAALASEGRWFDESSFRTLWCFFCFLVPVLFAFAAGAVAYRPAIAHGSALAGLVGAPWVYWTALQDTPMGNTWTQFNVPDRDLLEYGGLLLGELTILAVGLMVLAVATAALRLLPAGWKLRGRPLSERTWPALLASVVFLAVWFSQSVMPYRISGAMDYARVPIVRILHIEKRGVQFHEIFLNIWGYQKRAESISFSGNDRRLFQYRFQQREGSVELNEPFKDRIAALTAAPKSCSGNWELGKPLRGWNADVWYVGGQNVEPRVFTTENGGTPPQELVDLFGDFQKLPRLQETQSVRKDVCLGFCYDPLSALGFLYANHRCHDDRTPGRYTCR